MPEPSVSERPTAPAPFAGTGAVGASGRSGVGVLFDLDDTLLDLRTAMRGALGIAAARELDGLPAAQRDAFTEHFSLDPGGYYDRYVAGELGFAEQRFLRLRAALTLVGRTPNVTAEDFSTRFEAAVVSGWAPFPDVAPVLDALDKWGVPYGVVTNNVAAYQRRKLDGIGLGHVEVLIGSDTAGAPKPDARAYLAGATALGTVPGATLMVGDNPEADVAGAVAAGLPAVLVDRLGRYPTLAGVTALTGILPVVEAMLAGGARDLA